MKQNIIEIAWIVEDILASKFNMFCIAFIIASFANKFCDVVMHL